MKSIVFDCDGIICDFIKGFYDWYYANHYNYNHGDISRNPHNWNFDWSGDSQTIQRLIYQYIADKPILDLIFPEMPKIMATLKQTYSIFIVTHYPDSNTRLENLTKLGILKGVHYDELYCLNSSREKVNMVLKLAPLHYVEDAPHIIKQIALINQNINIYVPTNYNYCKSIHEQNINTTNIYYYDNPNQLFNIIINCF